MTLSYVRRQHHSAALRRFLAIHDRYPTGGVAVEMRLLEPVRISTLLEAVRGRSRTVDLPHVNRVLLQPHWRQDHDVI